MAKVADTRVSSGRLRAALLAGFLQRRFSHINVPEGLWIRLFRRTVGPSVASIGVPGQLTVQVPERTA